MPTAWHGLGAAVLGKLRALRRSDAGLKLFIGKRSLYALKQTDSLPLPYPCRGGGPGWGCSYVVTHSWDGIYFSDSSQTGSTARNCTRCSSRTASKDGRDFRSLSPRSSFEPGSGSRVTAELLTDSDQFLPGIDMQAYYCEECIC